MFRSDAEYLQEMMELVLERHKGQVDRNGHLYVLHPIRVMMACETVEQKLIALGTTYSRIPKQPMKSWLRSSVFGLQTGSEQYPISKHFLTLYSFNQLSIPKITMRSTPNTKI